MLCLWKSPRRFGLVCLSRVQWLEHMERNKHVNDLLCLSACGNDSRSSRNWSIFKTKAHTQDVKLDSKADDCCCFTLKSCFVSCVWDSAISWLMLQKVTPLMMLLFCVRMMTLKHGRHLRCAEWALVLAVMIFCLWQLIVCTPSFINLCMMSGRGGSACSILQIVVLDPTEPTDRIVVVWTVSRCMFFSSQ